MTTQEFNSKWKDHLEEGHYGLAISHPKVIEYLDREFEQEVKVNPEFEYSQIKLKFGIAVVYSNSKQVIQWEDQIDQILKEDETDQR